MWSKRRSAVGPGFCTGDLSLRPVTQQIEWYLTKYTEELNEVCASNSNVTKQIPVVLERRLFPLLANHYFAVADLLCVCYQALTEKEQPNMV